MSQRGKDTEPEQEEMLGDGTGFLTSRCAQVTALDGVPSDRNEPNSGGPGPKLQAMFKEGLVTS